VILLAALLLGGCGSNGDGEIQSENTETSQTETATSTAGTETVTTTSKMTVTTAAETTVMAAETTVQAETSAEETTSVKPKYMENESLLIGFLSYLRKTEPPNEVHFVFDHGNSFDQYDFMDDFKIDGYSYQHRGDGSYNVKLICSDSTCDLFPDGESYCFFGQGRFCRYEEKDDVVTDYEFYEKYKDYPNYETISTAFDAARTFSFSTDVFEADETWFNEVQAADTHWLYHSYNPYLTMYEDGGVYPDDFRAAVKKLYNITLPEDAFGYHRIDENGRIFASCGHGGTWRYEALAGYEETESEVKVTVNFYGDEMYFYPVIQSEFTFSKNADGNITLQKVEKIFDRDYRLAIGTV
ncbi:MAG: hypothetical protein K2K44_12865, partial [Oscillospiraceae bacterium]|nr:hypothetical protein [Oscillospiraceae bacterium]